MAYRYASASIVMDNCKQYVLLHIQLLRQVWEIPKHFAQSSLLASHPRLIKLQVLSPGSFAGEQVLGSPAPKRALYAGMGEPRTYGSAVWFEKSVSCNGKLTIHEMSFESNLQLEPVPLGQIEFGLPNHPPKYR